MPLFTLLSGSAVGNIWASTVLSIGAGLVGADGPTHHGALDLSYLRCIPNMIVTNAAGGVHPDFEPGDVMLITDQLNMMGMSGLNPRKRRARNSDRQTLSQSQFVPVDRLSMRLSTIVAVIAFGMCVLAGSAVLGVNFAVSQAVSIDARTKAADWAKYFISTLPNLDQLLANGKLDARQPWRLSGW